MSGFKYVIVLHIPKFLKIWQSSEYASGSNYQRVQNIPGIQVGQFSAYARVVNMPEYG